MTHMVRPRSLAEALEAFASSPELTPAAGSTLLMLGAPPPGGVLDLTTVPELRGIRTSEDGLEIGATTTFSEIRADDVVRRRFPALASAADTVGAWQIRNRATLGGNAASGSASADAPPVLLALEAIALIDGPGGPREVPYLDFHTGPGTTALGSAELLTGLRLPWPTEDTRQDFRKVAARRSLATAKLTVALAVRLGDGQTLLQARLAAANVGAAPQRLQVTENLLRGRTVNRRTATIAGVSAARQVSPVDDPFSTAEYRSFALERVVRRMVLSLR